MLAADPGDADLAQDGMSWGCHHGVRRSGSWPRFLAAPGDDTATVTAGQVREVVERLITAGHWQPGDPDMWIVANLSYDGPRLALLLADLPVQLRLRLRPTGSCDGGHQPSRPATAARRGMAVSSSSVTRTWTSPAGNGCSRTARTYVAGTSPATRRATDALLRGPGQHRRTQLADRHARAHPQTSAPQGQNSSTLIMRKRSPPDPKSRAFGPHSHDRSQPLIRQGWISRLQ
jgi:hypothetical protein